MTARAHTKKKDKRRKKNREQSTSREKKRRCVCMCVSVSVSVYECMKIRMTEGEKGSGILIKNERERNKEVVRPYFLPNDIVGS